MNAFEIEIDIVSMVFVFMIFSVLQAEISNKPSLH